MVAFPSRQSHPRLRARLLQIGSGGCAFATEERLYIGEKVLVWATGGGKRYLGTPGKIVWMKTVYEEGPKQVFAGVEWAEPIELPAELLTKLGHARPAKKERSR